jgi:hypothetical protein
MTAAGETSTATFLGSLMQGGIKRGNRGTLYHVVLVLWICVNLLLLMGVPYAYDQYNRKVYESALRDDNLVIQEFRPVYENNIISNCKQPPCTVRDIHNMLRYKRLISLDYVSQMEHASQLTFGDFAKTLGVMLTLLAIIIWLISKFVSNVLGRFISIIFITMFVIAGIHISGLPHANVKFYYIFGLLLALTFSFSDYLHNVQIVDLVGPGVMPDSKYMAIALQERHKKWTAFLSYSLAIVVLIGGTLSFNTIYYIRTIFGDGFLVAPTIGIAGMCTALVLFFTIGVIGNIRTILLEIETAISGLRDSAASVNPS